MLFVGIRGFVVHVLHALHVLHHRLVHSHHLRHHLFVLRDHFVNDGGHRVHFGAAFRRVHGRHLQIKTRVHSLHLSHHLVVHGHHLRVPAHHATLAAARRHPGFGLILLRESTARHERRHERKCGQYSSSRNDFHKQSPMCSRPGPSTSFLLSRLWLCMRTAVSGFRRIQVKPSTVSCV